MLSSQSVLRSRTISLYLSQGSTIISPVACNSAENQKGKEKQCQHHWVREGRGGGDCGHRGETEISDCACVQKANVRVWCRWLLPGKVKGYRRDGEMKADKARQRKMCAVKRWCETCKKTKSVMGEEGEAGKGWLSSSD